MTDRRKSGETGDADVTNDNLEYYERRAREEAEAAEKATSAEAASAHRLLAIEYEAHARELRAPQPQREKLKLRPSGGPSQERKNAPRRQEQIHR